MSDLDYIAGDPIYIFSDRGPWGPANFANGIVKRVTKTGQVVVDLNGTERRFTTAGREIGNSGGIWTLGPWIEPKTEADKRAAVLRKEHAKVSLKRMVKDDLEALLKLDPSDQGDDLIAGLRALIHKLSDPQS